MSTVQRPMVRVPFDPATDYYQLLGVPPGASSEEIQAAYRRLAKTYHPDLHADSVVAAARMARVNVAKSVLLDRAARASYDQLRATRPRPVQRIVQGQGPPPAPSTMRYAPHQAHTRPRYRVVPTNAVRAAPRSSLDRQTGILLVVAVPLIAALVLYVLQAVQVSVQPLRSPPVDVNLSQAPVGRPTPHGSADAVFILLHAQPPSRELANRANNLILSRSDPTPEGELLRADGRRLLRSAASGDTAAWEATVADVCQLAGRC